MYHLISQNRFAQRTQPAEIPVGLKVKMPLIISAGLKLHRDALVEPAWQAEFEVPAVELVPALVANNRKCSVSADVVGDAGTI